MKIFLYYIGRAKDAHANAIAADFVGRAAHFTPCEMREINPAKFDVFSRHPAARKILLDPLGKEIDSSGFAKILDGAAMQGQDLVFLIGGHDGLTAEQRTRADLLLSLGRMTWPHELARAMLAEQIYRGFAILKNHPYVR
ncbi:MAG: 23S rRNA (pseudouridine(1915)-N(3))-methyltransferase RlmH [Acidobacteria bacterium]|nr:23S rRNA (pseudouridine(1915)-N(3))-methyltransferase RlmH [Acidobacteriota bacterium]